MDAPWEVECVKETNIVMKLDQRCTTLQSFYQNDTLTVTKEKKMKLVRKIVNHLLPPTKQLLVYSS